MNSTDITNDSYLKTKKFKNAIEFSMFIEGYSKLHRLSCMDGIIEYCTRQSIEIETIGPLISKSLKEKIRVEAIEQNFFKQKGQLEI